MPLVATWMTVPGKPLSEISEVAAAPEDQQRLTAPVGVPYRGDDFLVVPRHHETPGRTAQAEVVKRDRLTCSRTLAMGGVRAAGPPRGTG